MGGVKNWLMEMQEYSWYLLDKYQTPVAQDKFIEKYGESQLPVFEQERERTADDEADWLY